MCVSSCGKACRQRERERVSRSARVARGASLRYFRFHSELPHPAGRLGEEPHPAGVFKSETWETACERGCGSERRGV